jgi:hypothetical protein
LVPLGTNADLSGCKRLLGKETASGRDPYPTRKTV